MKNKEYYSIDKDWDSVEKMSQYLNSIPIERAYYLIT